MFTGIIKSKGKILSVKDKKNQKELIVEAVKNIFKGLKVGSSIAVDGVCLTITKSKSKKAYFDLMNETIKLTNLKNAKTGTPINLEPAIKFGDSLDGHLVQGHIDTTGEVLSLTKNKNESILRIEYPKKFKKFLVLKGSIAVNGVSLTISSLKENFFEVNLVKHTLENTTLSILKKGSIVNIEFDMIVKYIKNEN